MSDIDSLLAKQAGQSLPTQNNYNGESVVVSGLPQKSDNVDSITKLLQDQASSNNESRAIAESKVDPNAGSYSRIGNLGYGALKGAADLVQSPAQIGLNAIDYANRALPGGGSKFITKANTNFNDYLKNQEELYQLDTPDSVSAGIGRAISSAIPFLITGGGSAPTYYAQMASKASQLGGLMAKGAGIATLTQPATNVVTNQDGSNDFLSEKGSQALGGAIGAPIGQLAGKALGAIISPVGSIGGSLVKKAYDSGMIPSIGKILGMEGAESSLSKVPFVSGTMGKAAQRVDDKLNTAVYNRALNPIGIKADQNIPIGHDSVLAVKKSLGDAYDRILPNVTFKADDKFLGAIDSVTAKISDGSIPAAKVAQFNSVINNSVLPKLNNSLEMDGEAFKLASRKLDKLGKQYIKSLDPEDQILGQAYKDISSAMKESLPRNNPMYADELRKIDQGYANYAILREVAKKPSTENGKFTADQLARGVYKMDQSTGGGASAVGQARMQDLVKMAEAARPSLSAGQKSEPFSFNSILGAIPGVIASPMYTDFGSRALAAALLKRADSAPIVANYARNKAPALGAILGGKVGQQFNNNQED